MRIGRKNVAVNEESLEATVASVEENERGLVIRLRLRNHADRALHYIAAVRGLDYDPDTRRLTVRLSDVGRVVLPDTANVRPPIRSVDPAAEAEVTLQLPTKISKLAPDPGGDTRRVAFERQRIADAEDVVVEVAWADVPYYEDRRKHDASAMPSVRWQQHQQSATFQRRSGEGSA
jgi:hypothetical protein